MNFWQDTYVRRTFTVELEHPCKNSIFETNPNPLSDMTINMPGGSTQTQAFHVFTDVERANSALVCEYEVSLSPQSDFLTITLDGKLKVDSLDIVLPDHIGSHSFKLTVSSKNYSSTVLSVELPFNVHIICDTTSVAITDPIADMTFNLNEGPTTTS